MIAQLIEIAGLTSFCSGVQRLDADSLVLTILIFGFGSQEYPPGGTVSGSEGHGYGRTQIPGFNDARGRRIWIRFRRSSSVEREAVTLFS